jgi:hypothetical protein
MISWVVLIIFAAHDTKRDAATWKHNQLEQGDRAQPILPNAMSVIENIAAPKNKRR